MISVALSGTCVGAVASQSLIRPAARLRVGAQQLWPSPWSASMPVAPEQPFDFR